MSKHAGCTSCKKSRIKCDEIKPACTQCTARRVECGGYQKDLVWRSFREESKRPFRTDRERRSRTNAVAYHFSRQKTPGPAKLKESRFADDVSTLPSASYNRYLHLASAPSTNQVKCGLSLRGDATYDRQRRGPVVVRPIHDSVVRRSNISSHAIECTPTEDAILGELRYDIPASISPCPAERLTIRFHRETAGILSINDGPHENPWRTLMWHMAANSDALYHALLAMAALHGSSCDPHLRTIGVLHTTESIRRLMIEMHNVSWEQTLATALALALGETWYHRTSTGMNHLKGVRQIVLEALAKRQQSMQLGLLTILDAKRVKFLVNTYVYLYAIACLTSTEDYDVVDLYSMVNAVNQPSADGGHEIDPLMGCATTLFPLLGRVASIIRRVRRAPMNSPKDHSEANELKECLLHWEAPAVCISGQSEDLNIEAQHALLTAEAYRRAVLLHLELAVVELSSTSPTQQAMAILTMLAATPLSSRTVIVQIFPLLICSCEVTSVEDRLWVTQRWQAMIDRLAIVNVASCWEVVKEVWKRRDAWQEAHPSGVSPANCRSPSYSHSLPRTNMSETYSRRAHRRSASEDSIPRLGRQPVDMSRPGDRRAYSVRGYLHWLSVMSDWGWEGKFRQSCRALQTCVLALIVCHSLPLTALLVYNAQSTRTILCRQT